MIVRGLRLLHCHVVLVEIIAFEELLDAVPPQLLLTFLHGLRVLPLLIVHVVRVEVVHVDVGDVARLHAALRERVPVEVVEPGVLLELERAARVTDPVHRLPLQALVDEVRCLLVPAVRDPVLLYLHLAAQDLISDVFAGATFVGPLAHHALVGDDTDGEVVGDEAVVLPAHDLGCHVAGRSARLARVIGREYARDAEVGQAQVSLVVEDEVLWLDVAMNYQLVVHGLERVHQAGDEEAGHLHRELTLSSDVVSQVTAEEQVHDEVEIHVVLEGVVDVDDELAADHREELQLVHHARHTLLSDDSRLCHLFHCELLILVLFRLHSPDLAEAAAADGVHLREVGFAHLLGAILVLRRLKVAIAHCARVSAHV